MRNLIALFISRPVFASMIIAAFTVVGASAFYSLGVDRLPSVDLPTVTVRTTLPGASPQEMETEIVEPLEEVVNTIEGIDELRSIAGSGSAVTIATFNLERDIDTAAQDVRDRVATVLRRLPEGVDPPTVSKFDNDSSPVLTLSLYGQRTLRELTEIADKLVKVQLERSSGVGEIQITGGSERTVNINLDADRLAALNLPVVDVRDAIARENLEIPGGNVTGALREQNLRTLGKLTVAADFENIVIATANGSPIRIRDVARVEDGLAEQRSVSRLNGVPAVTLEIRRQSGANTIAVIEAVKENLERVKEQLPPGVELEIVRDQSRYIYQALHEIEIHLVLGSILACLVVYLFTSSWRSTIIAGIAIPTSVITTFAVMWMLDFTLNSVTMLALVLMVGIVIDDAIVVLENVFRFAEEKDMSPFEAALEGSTEIALAVVATTLSLAVIFIPVSFMSSISGRFLYQFGITAAVAVIVSLVVSFVLTPTLSARMLGSEIENLKKHSHGSRSGFYAKIDALYTRQLEWFLKHSTLATAGVLLIMLSSVPLFMFVQQGFLPQGADEAEFRVSVEGPQEMSFTAMNDALQRIEADIRAMPNVRLVLSTVGGGFIGNVSQGDIYVRIAPHEERYFGFGRMVRETLAGTPWRAFQNNYTQTEVMMQIREKLKPYAKNRLRVSVRGYPSFNIGGGNFDIDFSVSGPDLEALARYSSALVERGEKIGGIINLETTLRLDKPELNVVIDRERAADLGIRSEDIGSTLRLLVGGDQEISRFRDPKTNENYDVRLRLDEPFRNGPDKLPQLLIRGNSGNLIELRSIATLQSAISAARIDRSNRARDARVRGAIAPGFALAERTQALLAEAKAMNLPPEYQVGVRGQGKEFERTYREFVIAFILSIVFMYMILASQYEHLIHPVTILLSLPLSVPFALLSLLISGEQLNLYSALGILVLFGVVKKNSILQIDHINQLREKGLPRYEAIVQGCRDRLRPILMTTLCLVAGMLPLWLGTGPGAEERRSVAVVVIGGQSLSLLLTLLFTPVAYALLEDFFASPRQFVSTRIKALRTSST